MNSPATIPYDDLCHINRVAEDDEEWFAANMLFRTKDRIAQALRLTLANEMEVCLLT